jgi:hypothetical protein
VPCAMKTRSSAMYPPEYASSKVVVIVPMTERPIVNPDLIGMQLGSL